MITAAAMNLFLTYLIKDVRCSMGCGFRRSETSVLVDRMGGEL